MVGGREGGRRNGGRLNGAGEGFEVGDTIVGRGQGGKPEGSTVPTLLWGKISSGPLTVNSPFALPQPWPVAQTSRPIQAEQT